MSSKKKADGQQPLYKLSQEERNDPTLVFDELFDFAHLPQFRCMLWDWLKATVTGSYPKSLSGKERIEIILLYEKVEKLIEAAHLLKERKKTRRK